MTPTQFIITAAVVAALCFFAYICGYKSGREDEREEVKITKRQRARKLMVVRTAGAFCDERSAANIALNRREPFQEVGLPSQNTSDWFNPRIGV